MMIIQRFLVMGMCAAGSIGWVPNAVADERVCTQQEAQEAESLVATVKSWRQLHQQFERYAHCDDGAIAEGFSESFSLLLTVQWRDIGELGDILKSDQDFRKFVIQHIDETVPADRLRRIAKNARKRCSKSLKKLCGEIVEAAAVQK